MRDSADSADYGITRRGKKKRGKFDDDQAIYAKRDRHLPRLRAEDANDATDRLSEGDRWSTWDQTENLVTNDGARRPTRGGAARDGMSRARRRVGSLSRLRN
jgi:hypothetical protein